MKRNFKKVLTILFAVAFVFCLVPARAQAAADTTVYMAYADGSWKYQYWGAPVDTGIVSTDATVTGPGQYSVGLDFTGTEDGAATDLAFTAIMTAKDGQTNFPGYIFEINSIKINGTDINFTKGYTSCDEDGNNQMRENIYNGWVAEVPADARTIDGDVSDASPTIVDLADFASVETITVDFTVYDADGNDGSATVTDGSATVTDDVAIETDDTASATDDAATTTDVPKTGVVGLGLVYGLGAIATGAAVLKRKGR